MEKPPHLITEDMPRKKYDKTLEKQLSKKNNLHWGQRKLFLTELQFLTHYYHMYDSGEKLLLYIGSGPGHHINFLMQFFPDLTYHLYDKVPTKVPPGPNVKIFYEYFTEKHAQRYVNKNVFIVCDIRNLEIATVRKKMKLGQAEMQEMDTVVLGDMELQRELCEIIKPKAALLKFRLPYDGSKMEYYCGPLYIQPWAKNASSETRIVPQWGAFKIYNSVIYEEQMFYFNTVTRRQKFANPGYHCLGTCFDCMLEAQIIREFVERYESITKNKIYDRVCEISSQLTQSLNKTTQKPVNASHIIDIEPAPENDTSPLNLSTA